MTNIEISDDFEIQDAEAASMGINEFVFHNNQEFINFQRCFVDGHGPDYEPVFQQNANTELVFHPSNECDHITLTFMYNGGEPYQIINNRAFYLKGFKKIVIQGARSRKSQRCNIPVLEVVNECAEGAPTYLDSNGNACHSYSHDDAIFNIQNPHSNPVDVVVSDVEFRVAFKLQDVEEPRRFPSAIILRAAEEIDGPEENVDFSDGKVDYLYKRWYNPTICPVLFKVYEASSFKMFNVKMYSQYLDLTHVFIHWCENVDIRNCVFKNYNARKIGGNLWLCQRVKNVTVVNNDFYKYGNDENIGIWGDSIMSRDELNCYSSEDTLVGLDDEKYVNRHLEFEHIHIKNNRFYYEKPAHPFESESEAFPEVVNLENIHAEQLTIWEENDSEPQWDGVIDIFQNVYVVQHTPFGKINFGTGNATEENKDYAIVPYVHYRVSDVVVRANEFYINSPMKVLMGFTFDNFCRTEGFQITNNLIKYGPWAHNQCQLQDFKIVFDKNPHLSEPDLDLEGTNKMCLEPIHIEGNTIDSSAFPFMAHYDKTKQDYYASETHIVLNVENAGVQFNGNTINEDNRRVQNTIDQNPNKIVNLNSQIISDVQNHGYYLLYSRNKGGVISMSNNVSRGMHCMGSFDMTDAVVDAEKNARVELHAENNLFQGITTFISKRLAEGIFKFSKNVFFSADDRLILNGLPLEILLTLHNNIFKRNVMSNNNAVLYRRVSKEPVSDVNLTLISSGNIFENIKGSLCSQDDNLNAQIFTANEHPIDEPFGNEN